MSAIADQVVPAQREQLSERFQQGEGELITPQVGSGLGLAIVREFVDLHGGIVTANIAGWRSVVQAERQFTLPARLVYSNHLNSVTKMRQLLLDSAIPVELSVEGKQRIYRPREDSDRGRQFHMRQLISRVLGNESSLHSCRR